MKSITVREYKEKDFEAVVQILEELSRYYLGEASSRETISDNLSKNILGSHSGVQLLVALDGRKRIGIATISIMYPAPKETGQLYLKELFIREFERNKGYGKLIMKQIANIAIEHNCSRLDWSAEKTNPNALAFYNSISAQVLTEKVYYRFSGESLRRFAKDT